MKLFMHPASITSRPVRLLIAQKGLDVEQQVVDLFSGEHHQEPYISINPNRLVPVLEDGELKLTESATILRYLAEKYDMPEYPKELKKRARVNEIMDWFNSNFYRDWGYNLCYPQLFPHHRRPSEEGHKVAVEWGSEKSTFWLQVLDNYWLGDGRAYLAGNDITIADYFGASIMALGDMIRQTYSKYPNVERWLTNVKKLEKWDEVSEALDGFAASLEGQQFVSA